MRCSTMQGLHVRFADHLDIRRLGGAKDARAQPAAGREADQRAEGGGDNQVRGCIADAFAGGEAVDAHDGQLFGLSLDIGHGEVCHDEAGHHARKEEHEHHDKGQRLGELLDRAQGL